MSEESKAVVQKVYDAINAGDMGALAAAVADDFVEHELQPGVPPNKDGVIQFFTGVASAFEGFRMDIEAMHAEGDRVSILCSAHGKHVGDFLGIPGTGKDVSVPVADFFRVRGDQVCEHWGVMDSGAMLMQMGILQPPGA
jgi:steroid delta-isomerase-like uncharacterized protein